MKKLNLKGYVIKTENDYLAKCLKSFTVSIEDAKRFPTFKAASKQLEIMKKNGEEGLKIIKVRDYFKITNFYDYDYDTGWEISKSI